ncbi:MAG: 16S rRNA (guanine(966)-N(2))-methyltransferase RsmD [Candidatus Rokubacteria bacterium GWC2_70_16]|nr:MAG: 16S rRNA (guanine(966)-N(2))-methyltransferase RsmD [Candidatus Rokubacteria bacterium GWC2_70_16]OGL16045.1 MAG: 16S rRNA (guanine(966)-N(2))-methyltransferase RsmD [Candidatus Rokubacteria bacterium RIFCSPLOWO2_12_FULL_71_19]
MRVLAGDLKGRRLTTPTGRTTRPTSDQVRIACLDTLMPYLAAGPFLDLFAGAGGVGIEALSRGAPSATFVEQDTHALRALRANVERLGLSGRARVLRADSARALERLGEAGERFAVVFLDPPYDSPRALPALERLAEGTCLVPGAVVVVQHATKSPPPSTPGALASWKSRRFGETTLTFFRGPA